eukprot:Skav231459  [mRNA]  locus=scaffold1847:913848:918299:- [translate_table: standard]
MPRQVLRSQTRFGSFYRAMLSKPHKGLEAPLTAPLWPMPLPYDFGGKSCNDVDNKAESFKRAINLQVAVLNYLHMNGAELPPPWICGKKTLSAAQWSVVHRLERLSDAWNQMDVIRADDMGRVAAKQERQEQALADLTNLATSVVSEAKKYQRISKRVESSKRPENKPTVIGHLHGSDLVGAQQIIADRIKMEGDPVFDPVPFLHGKTKELYVEPFSSGISPDDLVDKPPRVRIHATTVEKIKLLKLLETTGRLAFRGANDVVEGWGSGMFCVCKNTKVDRLILDGRPANMLQHTPNEYIMTMASSSSALLGLHLKPNEKLIMSGDDLSNFFYTFKVNDKRTSRNFLDWKIPISIAKQFDSFPSSLCGEKYVYACLSTLAMGDSAACEYAQTSHLAMALQSNSLRPEELLTIHGRTPRGHFVGGIIIDDICFLEKVPIHMEQSLIASQRRQCMHGMYERVGLQAHPDKGFSDEELASFWGADIDGREGLVRGSLCRAASLVWITTQVARLGFCSVGLLEVLCGGYVSLFTYRRRMLSLLDWMYSVQSGLDQSAVVELPPQCIEELWTIAILCPLAVTDLRASFHNRVFMVDASSWGDAVVSSALPEGLQDEIHRHCLVKSCWTRLLSPFRALQRSKGILPPQEELPGDQEPYTEHPVWEVAARGLQYHLEWKQRAKAGRHINVGELRSFVKAEAIAGMQHQGDIRIPIGSDSQVSLGATVKGRSASVCLNQVLRQSLPYQLGLGIYSCGGYVRSAHNPSDDPTRGKELREPDIELPTWWVEAGKGNYDELDEFLEDCSLGPHDISGYPPLNRLSAIDTETFDKPFTQQKFSRDKAVRHKLRLRAMQKQTDSDRLLDRSTKEDGFQQKSESVFDPDLIAMVESFGKDQIILHPDCPWPPTEPGFLDVYSGRKGFAKASIRYGAKWVVTIDIDDGPQCDVLDAAVRRKLLRLIGSGIFEHVSCAPVCGSFSRAITPPVRSREFPRGIPGVSAKKQLKIDEGNQHSLFVAHVVKLCNKMKIAFWIENPFLSHLWYQPEWLELQPMLKANFFGCDFCRYGAPWRKRTRFYVGRRSLLCGMTKYCSGGHRHVLLRGRAKGKSACMTKLAEPYPRRLCLHLAHSVCSKLGRYHGPQTLTCGCDHRRIGEAKNPGPARRAGNLGRDPSAIDRVELVRPETLAIGKAHWDKFMNWIREQLDEATIHSLWLNHGILSAFLASYGKHWYGVGGALFNLRHLYIYAQRNHPGLRNHMQECWNVVSKWEELEPVEHRRPVPVALLRAMVVLALSWGWNRVAAVLLISFHGCCRPGEVLTALRRALILPEDVGATKGSACFLRICKPKPGRRGMGRVQHVKIQDPSISVFLSHVLSPLLSTEYIYPGTSGAFRTRWNKLLLSLGIPLSTKITPGCLRAGGTVELYKQGMPIMDILWRLRLKNLETLQHYLQEISTDITMIDFPAPTRLLIQNMSFIFDHFISHFCCDTGEVQYARN